MSVSASSAKLAPLLAKGPYLYNDVWNILLTAILADRHQPRAAYTVFANRRMGGGFLARGLVQEEIITHEFPEMVSPIIIL